MITTIDPYVISQYVINFAHGMQEDNANEFVADSEWNINNFWNSFLAFLKQL